MRRHVVPLLLLLLPTMARAGAEERFTLDVPRLDAPPSIRGVIDGTWAKSAQAPVTFDFSYQRDGEPTTVYVAQDGDALDIAFVVTQRRPITANTQTNGSAVASDDYVSVDLWPQGSAGFHYDFMANARAARYQTSSENSAYSPEWAAAAKRSASGYTVTMRIPFEIMRSAGSSTWGVQFSRVVQASNSTQVWVHLAGQRTAVDSAYEGTLTNIGAEGARPRARLQVYGLAEMTTAAEGGSTSRVGANLSIPVTATSSFVASLHPDYSNIEIDQQTISPNAFRRSYSEVRPFFTQLSGFNDDFSCTNCPTLLYTPSIPAFRDAYGYEGTQGNFQYAAFDAIGNERNDNAQVVNYAVRDAKKIMNFSLQRVRVSSLGIGDEVTSLFTGYESQKTHYFLYFNGAMDRGRLVRDPGLANYMEYGVGYIDKDTVYGAGYQEIGPQFNPVDGYVEQPDLRGAQAFYKRTFYLSNNGTLQDIKIDTLLNEQNDHQGDPAFKGANAEIDFDFRHEFTLHVLTNSFKHETQWGEYLPFTANGLYIGYKAETTTPTSVMWTNGAYYHGSLMSWSYLMTRPLLLGLNLSLELDENSYTPQGFYVAAEPVARQWLERASLDWQFSGNASLDVSARRIVGRNLPNAFLQPFVGDCSVENQVCPFGMQNAGNVSAAFHFLASQNEWYVAYGNPNTLSTQPAFYVKWIRYIGAEKGT